MCLCDAFVLLEFKEGSLILGKQIKLSYFRRENEKSAKSFLNLSAFPLLHSSGWWQEYCGALASCKTQQQGQGIGFRRWLHVKGMQ